MKDLIEQLDLSPESGGVYAEVETALLAKCRDLLLYQAAEIERLKAACDKFSEAELLAAPKAAQPLTVEAYTAIAHRTASKYAHRSDPAHVVYTFFPHTLDDFVRKIESAVGGHQP